METNKRGLTLSSINGLRKRVDTNPDFQRPPVWSTAQKQLLVDTILRDYDVPKLYWRRTGTKPDTYDVVDGQQRLRTVWEFFDGRFRLPKDAEPLDGFATASLDYESLPEDLRFRFDAYQFDVVILNDTNEDEVREMFLRLQNGTSLKAQEKRNAFPGKMRDFVKELAQHPFFSRVGFKNSRYTYDHVAAQLTCLELAGGPTNVKDADLNRMYESAKAFDSKSHEAKAVRRVLTVLADLFSDKTPELHRYNVISLYCVIAELLRLYVFDEIKPHLCEWFIAFEQERQAEEENPEDDAKPEWVAYKGKISHSTDAADSIRFRMEFMLERLLEQFPTLSQKDPLREFIHSQRLAVYRRDKGMCQLRLKCDGKKVTWDDWHCDHSQPWSKGGATTVKNGLVACTPCNLSKGSD